MLGARKCENKCKGAAEHANLCWEPMSVNARVSGLVSVQICARGR